MASNNFLAFVGITVVFVMQLYFCIVTLWVLRRPSPCDAGTKKKNTGNEKIKAFRILLFITVSLILVYFPFIIVVVFEKLMKGRLYFIVFLVCSSDTAVIRLLKALIFLQRTGHIAFMNWMLE